MYNGRACGLSKCTAAARLSERTHITIGKIEAINTKYFNAATMFNKLL